MKKYKVITLLVIIVTIISGCTIQADENKDVTYPVLEEVATRSIEPSRVDTETIYEDLEEPSVVERQATHVEPGGATWIYAKTQDGVRGTRAIKYKLTYNKKDELLSRIEIPNATEITDTTPTLYEGGQRAQAGAYYSASRITRYGVDCNGCNVNEEGKGGTSSGVGVGVDSVRQRDGSWQEGITYQGYYIIATSSSIPLCSIVEVSDHTVSGKGITPGVPFKAIVLDRGGAIQGSKMDLFIGSESNMGVSQGRNQAAEVTIISLNSRVKDNGVWNCGV
uniref:3D domain-containing protein n=1 Tax=Jeotgalibaca porci TaxID=1868793 RepID=UPI0035A1CA7A